MKTIPALLALLLAALPVTAPAQDTPSAQASAEVRPDRVRYELAPPADPAHEFIHERLMRMGVLDRLSRFLSPFRLPRDVLMKVEGCKGEANAYYEEGVITVCYEYLAFVIENAPAVRAEDGISRREAVIGPTVDVFLHEMGHAVIDLLKIPVLGREEDAADLFSAYIQLHSGPEVARTLVLGVAFLGRIEARTAIAGAIGKDVELKQFAGEHGLPGQRYFNILCIAYGYDRVLFADAVSHWGLPPERAEGCAAEYRQLDHAFKTLIAPHIDSDLLAQVRERKWLLFGPPR